LANLDFIASRSQHQNKQKKRGGNSRQLPSSRYVLNTVVLQKASEIEWRSVEQARKIFACLEISPYFTTTTKIVK
jgi:hypothetical protein